MRGGNLHSWALMQISSVNGDRDTGRDGMGWDSPSAEVDGKAGKARQVSYRSGSRRIPCLLVGHEKRKGISTHSNAVAGVVLDKKRAEIINEFYSITSSRVHNN